MQHFYIIADDLTGANDAGVQLSKIGISSTVFLDFKESKVQPTGDVAIIDTDSRAVSEQEAYDRVIEASTIFHEQGYEHVYKKMDSTLRGNVAAELAAVVSVHQPELVVIAPAYPKMNRQTLQGLQYVNGQLVSETEFGRDPKTPVKDSFIPHLFQQHVDMNRICLIGQELLSGTAERLMDEILANIAQGRTWFICDAKTDDDLLVIAELFARVQKRTVWAGSAGLIEYLPEALQLQKTTGQSQEQLAIRKTLTVSASLSLVTKLQLEKVRAMTGTCFVELDPVDLIRQTYVLQDVMDVLSGESDKKHFVLFVDSSDKNRNATRQLEAEHSLGKTEISEAISRELGIIAREIVSSFDDIHGLVLTGGDTAKAVCNQLNMNQMQLYTEVEVGLPLGKLKNAAGTSMYWTVTKAGGFGNENSLVNVLKYMSGEDE
ncbi:four-carbon acid sugar kinase family protein [Paenibacillus dokdonensis]|uniref:Four-carbon acid sugar kinase family protein n=1 Tax=Paenibacillus dokdonensis TaxID=2567944 RepID=A0ABU6GLG9_9BACL|nr:four-carbon acid sugar kinase family protein [Paenibacillus dokdonensis]MEC0240601.1 four-carbon acid sugar kinase family protein [Paenibacillus dokdonensis]